MLLSGITILVACGGWAIIIDWRLGLVSIALLPALVVGMMFQVAFNKMMFVDDRSGWICCYCCLHRTAACRIVGWHDVLGGMTFEQFSHLQLISVGVFFAT